MISLADFQPPSVAKINVFSYISNRGFTERYFNDKVHAILIEEVPLQATLRDGASSVDRTKIFTSAFIFWDNILTLCCNV